MDESMVVTEDGPELSLTLYQPSSLPPSSAMQGVPRLKTLELANLPRAPTPLRSVNVRLAPIAPLSFHTII